MFTSVSVCFQFIYLNDGVFTGILTRFAQDDPHRAWTRPPFNLQCPSRRRITQGLGAVVSGECQRQLDALRCGAEMSEKRTRGNHCSVRHIASIQTFKMAFLGRLLNPFRSADTHLAFAAPNSSWFRVARRISPQPVRTASITVTPSRRTFSNVSNGLLKVNSFRPRQFNSSILSTHVPSS